MRRLLNGLEYVRLSSRYGGFTNPVRTTHVFNGCHQFVGREVCEPTKFDTPSSNVTHPRKSYTGKTTIDRQMLLWKLTNLHLLGRPNNSAVRDEIMANTFRGCGNFRGGSDSDSNYQSAPPKKCASKDKEYNACDPPLAGMVSGSGVRYSAEKKRDYVFSPLWGLGNLTSGVSTGTQSAYKTAWRQWGQFTRG